MNSNFLEFQYTDQIKTLVSTDFTGSEKKNYVTNKAPSNFSTKQAQEQQKSDHESFAELMNNLQKQKESSQNFLPTHTSKNEKIQHSAVILHTPIAATPIAKDGSENKTGLLDIATLNSQITQILTAQTEQALKTENTETSVLLVTTEEDEEKATATLLDALQSLQDKIKQQISEIGKEQETKPASQEIPENLSLLETISDHLDRILNSPENILVITNQRPEEITRIQSFIFDLLSREIDKQDEEMLAALAAQWSELAPPLKEPQKTEINKLHETKTVNSEGTAESGEITTLLPVTLGKPQDTLDTRHFSQERYDARYSLEGHINTGKQSALNNEGSFKNLVQDNIAKDTGKINAGTNQQATNQSASQRFLQNGSASFETLFTDITVSGSSAQAGINQSNAMLQNIATNPITQSSHAAQSHPATQAVMVNIQRIVKGGDNSNINMQLDPPELGRVEVKMSIGKDNASKIVLTIEKPETYAMLQRDAHILERALQDSGLNSQNDLSFELAEQNHDFNANDRGADSSGNGKSGHKTDISDDEVIYTTMDLQVDPATGRIRYNILV
ncbi:MAG: flagellar hook-length control protein FliK [Alphaproteobacteria bacterium]|nr:flagellar hook-length control protein FliK [Alphaproteobacteria bacterium]